MRILAALLLTIGSACAEVVWAGGRLSLGDAVALLAGSGHPTRLAPGADTAREATLPPLHSDYWPALLLVCRTWDLAIQEPEHRPARRDRPPQGGGMAIQVDSGPVELLDQQGRTEAEPGRLTGQDLAAWLYRRSRQTSSGPREEILRQVACGPYLVTILDAARAWESTATGERHRLGLSWRLRIAPGYGSDRLGTVRLHWQAVRSPGRSDLPLPIPPIPGPEEGGREDEQRGRSPAQLTIIEDLPPHLRRLRVDGRLYAQVQRREQLQLLLVPGQRRRVQLAGHEVTVWLRKAGENGEPGALGLELPPAMTIDENLLEARLQRIDGRGLRLIQNGPEFGPRHRASVWHFADMAVDCHLATITALVTAETLETPLSLRLELPR